MDQSRRILIGIIVVAVILRLVAALLLGEQVIALPGTFDQISYHKLALRVLDGHGFSFGVKWWPATRANEPTAHWSFLYTLYLAAVYAVSAANPLVARLVQAVASGILMPWLIYRIAFRLFSTNLGNNAGEPGLELGQARTIGLVAAGVSAIYAYFIYYAATLMTESFYFISILWTIDMAIQISQSKSIRLRQWLLIGLAMGIAVLLRQLFLLFVPFLLLWLWWSVRPRIRALLLPLAVVFALMLPWLVRNYLVFDQFVLLNTNSGYAFYWGNHPIYGTEFVPILQNESYYSLIPPELLHLNEAALDSALLGIALENVFEDPGRYILLSISRIPHYFVFWPMASSDAIGNLARLGSFGMFLPFMVIGLFYTLRYRMHSLSARIASPFFLLYLFILIYSGIHILTWTLIRYRLPIDSVLIIFAGLAIVRLGELIKRHRLPVFR